MELDDGKKTTIIPSPEDHTREVCMVDHERWAELRRLREETRVSISEIARRLDLDRKTVRRSLRQTTWQPFRRAAVTETLLTAHADVLDQVLGEAVASKAAKTMAMRTSLARFPFVKSREVFDFSYQPSLDKKQLQQVATCHFIEHGENVVIVGPPGVGKSHLAIGLGLHAIERGSRVLFTTAAVMIATLTRALTENRLEDKLKLYTIPRLLIIDEIGSLPIDRTGANLFFQLISRRYEKGPMILTSNQRFGAWGEIFGDRVLATAILDRVLHHAITINIRGHSYRLKEKLKAGLVRLEETAATT